MTAKTAALRAIFMQKLAQALKTKTGAIQTAAVKRIFSLAVRSLRDDQLSGLNLLLDYTPRGMAPAYYVSVAEASITKLVEVEAVQKLYGHATQPEKLATIMERVLKPIATGMRTT